VTAAGYVTPMPGGFLDRLSDHDRSDLLSMGRPRTFRRGASIVVQGDHSDLVAVLLRGRVKVTLDTADGHEIVLSVLYPGDLIGEFEAVDHDGGPRTASNVALEPIDSRVMTGEEFRSYLASHPSAVLAVLRSIIHRLRVADQRRIDSGSRELASLIAASRESIVRSLRSLRARQMIATGRRRIVIRNLAGLRQEADGQ
jgi:CRP/FNR family transcriptional regulator, cyclic AMP receptor protein